MGNYYVNYQNYQNSMLLTSSDTRRSLMHLFLFTTSPQSPKFKRVSLNETLEFPLWGLSISVDFDLEDLKMWRI